jgi:hypothetical protein
MASAEQSSSAATDSRPRVYRAVSRASVLVLPVAFAIGSAAVAIAPGQGQWVGFLFLPAFIFLIWQNWHLGAHVGVDGITVWGLVAHKHVPWPDIDHFAVRSTGRYPHVCQIIRARGPAVPIIALSASARAYKRHPQALQLYVDQLNQALQDWRQSHASPQSV